MSVVVEIPKSHRAHYRHAVELVLRWATGLTVDVVDTNARDYRVRVGERSVTVPDVFLRRALDAWLEPATVPEAPTETWDPRADYPGEPALLAALPRLFAGEAAGGDIALPIDVFGAAFFWATRYEEAASPERDHHDRMPCAKTLAPRLGILERAIVHEYGELLFRALRRIAPSLPRPERTFRIHPSHDIDSAFRWATTPFKSLVRSAGGEVLRRRAPRAALRHVAHWLATRRGDLRRDPHVTYDALMRESERRGLVSTFFFISDGSTNYSIEDPRVLAILANIHDRGHVIGLHSAYETYRDATKAASELELLKRACAKAGVTQETWPNRQHVLRWDPKSTPRNLSDLGFAYDATLGFADHIGFRTGMCVDHPAFDLVKGEILPLMHRPLVVMDATLTEPRYMGLAHESDVIRRTVADCRSAARTHGGDFGVLWHNSRLDTENDWQMYRAVLDG